MAGVRAGRQCWAAQSTHVLNPHVPPNPLPLAPFLSAVSPPLFPLEHSESDNFRLLHFLIPSVLPKYVEAPIFLSLQLCWEVWATWSWLQRSVPSATLALGHPTPLAYNVAFEVTQLWDPSKLQLFMVLHQVWASQSKPQAGGSCPRSLWPQYKCFSHLQIYSLALLWKSSLDLIRL